MGRILVKNFKTTCFKDAQRTKDLEKAKKTMYEQNGNISKEIENLKRNQEEIL